MTTYVWTGAASGVWATAGNWSPAGPPASNDTAEFPASVNAPCTDATGQTLIDLDLLHVLPGHTHDIGGVGAELTISADKILHEGSGTLHFVEGSGTTDLIEVNSPNRVLAMRIAGATSTEVVNIRGKVEVTGTVTTFVQTHLTNRVSDAEVTFTTSSTLGTLIASGGVVTINSNNAVTKVQANPGAIVFVGNSANATHTTWENNGGEIVYQPSGAVLTVTQLNAFSGTVRPGATWSGSSTWTASDAYTGALVRIAQKVTRTAEIVRHGRPIVYFPTGS